MTELPTLRQTVENYGLLAKKSLGQNFLLDMNITGKIIRNSLEKQGKNSFAGEEVYEIGPGPGGLTRAILAANPQQLTVIEMDSRCIQIMHDIQEVVGSQLQIVEGDALKYDFTKSSGLPVNVVSNLPYNISVPLLIGWLENMHCFNSLTLMFQKEVADRIMAETGSKSYGRLSVIAQLVCKIKPLMSLNPNCFVPAPKIWSTVLLFQPSEKSVDSQTLKKVEKITELAFGQRRKMIRQSLKSLPELEKLCNKAGIELTSRAEDITPQQYLLLAQMI